MSEKWVMAEKVQKFLGLCGFNLYVVVCRKNAFLIWNAVSSHLTLRLLMSYIYMERLFLMFLDHTRRRSTVGRTPLDE